MRRLIVLLAATGVATALAVPSAAAGEGDLEQFCKTNVKLEQVDEPSEKLLEKLRDTAPPEIAETVDAAVTQFQEQGEDAFEDEAFLALIDEIDNFLVDNCGFQPVTVSMQDYAFDGIPEEIERGTVAFSLLNEGAEVHEIHFVRLKGDATLEDIIDLPADAEHDEFEELGTEIGGGGFAFPGDSDLALVTFKKKGTYVALCSISIGSTPDAFEDATGAPHYTEGMAVEFEVT